MPDGSNPDVEAASCTEYDKLVAKAGYPDLQLLVLGFTTVTNGFNEPDDHFSMGTHCVDLTESKFISANSRLFERMEDVPRQAYTMGTQTPLCPRRVDCGQREDSQPFTTYGNVPRLSAQLSILQSFTLTAPLLPGRRCSSLLPS